MCPNCQEIKEFLQTVELEGKIIDATTDEGLKEAEELSVMGVPMMVFLDNDGKEKSRADNIDDIKKVLDNKSLLDI